MGKQKTDYNTVSLMKEINLFAEIWENARKNIAVFFAVLREFAFAMTSSYSGNQFTSYVHNFIIELKSPLVLHGIIKAQRISEKKTSCLQLDGLIILPRAVK